MERGHSQLLLHCCIYVTSGKTIVYSAIRKENQHPKTLARPQRAVLIFPRRQLGVELCNFINIKAYMFVTPECVSLPTT